MSKYSRVYKVGTKRFRYNYDEALLQWVSKVDKRVEDDNAEWLEECGHPLWDIEAGYVVNDSIGLSRDNWKESPRYWCEQYEYEINIESAYLAKDFEREMALYGTEV